MRFIGSGLTLNQNITRHYAKLINRITHMSSFLPKGYKAPEGSSSFMKLQEGANRFRIFGDAVIGWEGWKDNKPFRREGIDQNIEADEVDVDEKYNKPKINHFWAFKVWDYAANAVKILEITQKTVMKGMEDYINDEEFGHPSGYDISIEKKKDAKRTSYAVRAYPPKAVSPDVDDAVEASELDPNNLFKEAGETDEDEAADLPVARKPKAAGKKGRDF